MLDPTDILDQEARALLARVERVRPFALVETMVPAAAFPPRTQLVMERFVASGRDRVRRQVNDFLHWLRTPAARAAGPAGAQRRYAMLRMRYNAVLSHFDLFADVLTQRSESEFGVWLAGLDVAAADALTLPGGYLDVPPLICYLDRGAGAAIRRTRTRLPGNRLNPISIVRVPRERMVGSGVSASLVHEAGHEGAARLNLVRSLRPALRRMQASSGVVAHAWRFWERWISEILADLWGVARVGVSATLGLMGLASLPRAFVFHLDPTDPHPMPWLRVRLSCALGAALYPHPQWSALSHTWSWLNPRGHLAGGTAHLVDLMESTMTSFVSLLLDHEPESLRGDSLGEALSSRDREPRQLDRLVDLWVARPRAALEARPCLAFAVVGYARLHGRLSAQGESALTASLLKHWALRSAFAVSASCLPRAAPAPHRLARTGSA